jgi:hypothetical protein
MNKPAEKLESGQVVCSWRVRPAFMALGLLVFILLFQGSRHLWEPDEGRYTEGALQMVRTGEYIDVRLQPENEHFTKPPLTYWALALSYRVFGLNESRVGFLTRSSGGAHACSCGAWAGGLSRAARGCLRSSTQRPCSRLRRPTWSPPIRC